MTNDSANTVVVTRKDQNWRKLLNSPNNTMKLELSIINIFPIQTPNQRRRWKSLSEKDLNISGNSDDTKIQRRGACAWMCGEHAQQGSGHLGVPGLKISVVFAEWPLEESGADRRKTVNLDPVSCRFAPESQSCHEKAIAYTSVVPSRRLSLAIGWNNGENRLKIATKTNKTDAGGVKATKTKHTRFWKQNDRPAEAERRSVGLNEHTEPGRLTNWLDQ